MGKKYTIQTLMKKKSEVAIFIPDKTELRANNITRDKKEVNSLGRHRILNFY